MAIMEYAVVTELGLDLQAKLATGTTMTFTKFVSGSGSVSPVLMQKQTEVTDPEQEFLFSDKPQYSEEYPGEVVINMLMTNTLVTKEYHCSQIGIFANDPDDGEILYALLQTTEPFRVPTALESGGWSTEFEVMMKYGGADAVNIYVNAAGMLTRQAADKRYMKRISYGGKLYDFVRDENGVYLQESEDNSGETTDVFSISDADMAVLHELFIDNEELEQKVGSITASDVGARPDDWMPTASDVGAAEIIERDAHSDVITVDDSADLPFIDLNVYGKSTQFTTTGKNLLDSANAPAVKDSNVTIVRIESGIRITVNSEGEYSYCKFLIGDITPFKGKTLTFSYKADAHTTSKESYAAVQITDDSYNKIELYSGTFTIPSDTQGTKLVLVIYGSYKTPSGAGEYVDYTNLQLELGDTATAYEPYTGGIPSPNPEYPQEIESIENPDVYVHNQNVLWKLPDKTFTYKGVTFTMVDGVVTIKGTATSDIYTSEGISSNISWDLMHCAKAKMTLVVPEKKGNVSTILRVTKNGNTTYYGSLKRVVLDGTETRVNVYFSITSGTVVDETIIPCIFNSYFDGTEDSVVADRQTLSVPYTLHGIPVNSGGNYTDADGQQWICDEVDFERGVLVQRCKSVEFKGTENWVSASNASLGLTNCFAVSASDMQAITGENLDRSNILSNFFSYGGYACQFIESSIGGAERYIYIRFDGDADTITTVGELKNWLAEKNTAGNPVFAIYPLRAVEETPLTDAELEAYRVLHTNKPYTTVFNSEGADMDVSYVQEQYSETLKSLLSRYLPVGSTAEDVGAVPTSRTVNGKELSDDITLTASDVGARPNTWTPTASEVGALPLNPAFIKFQNGEVNDGGNGAVQLKITDRNGLGERFFEIFDKTKREAIGDAFGLSERVNGNYVSYRIYGEHNADVEQWTFTLEDGSTVTKSVVIGK